MCEMYTALPSVCHEITVGVALCVSVIDFIFFYSIWKFTLLVGKCVHC